MQEVNKSPLLLDFGVIQDDYRLADKHIPDTNTLKQITWYAGM